jgi:hypothetical protein
MRGDADLQCSAQEFRQLVLRAGSLLPVCAVRLSSLSLSKGREDTH